MSKIQYFAANTEGTDYICGDIHGSWANVETVLAYHNFDTTKDRLFCVGDLCDRGIDSDKVQEYLAQPWFFSIFGNHEELFCRAIDEMVADTGEVTWQRGLIKNGGNWIQQVDLNRLVEIANDLRKLPLAIELNLPNGKRVGLVHAEVQNTTWQDVINKLEHINNNESC